MSDDDAETTLEIPGLDKLIKTLGVSTPTVRVGVLGNKSARESSGGSGGSTNAEIGAAHEYGTDKLPIRSFLRVPISEHLEKKLESSGAFDADVLKNAMAEANLVPYMKQVAAVAEAIVIESFDTSGDGKWPPSNMEHKKVKQTLVETQQLRNSISSEVVEGSG